MTRTQRILEILPPPGDPVTVAYIARKLPDLTRKRISQSLETLRVRKLVDKPQTNRFILNAAGQRFRENGRQIISGPNGPHTGRKEAKAPSYRDRVWAYLRQQKKTTVPEIVMMVDDPNASNPRVNVQKYLKALRDAEYVSVLPRKVEGIAPTSNGFNNYMLIEDTGPLAPQWSTRKKELYDRNLGKIVYREGDHDLAE